MTSAAQPSTQQPSFTQPPQPHHYWWAGLAVSALTALRPVVKLSSQQDEAWQIVTSILQAL